MPRIDSKTYRRFLVTWRCGIFRWNIKWYPPRGKIDFIVFGKPSGHFENLSLIYFATFDKRLSIASRIIDQPDFRRINESFLDQQILVGNSLLKRTGAQLFLKDWSRLINSFSKRSIKFLTNINIKQTFNNFHCYHVSCTAILYTVSKNYLSRHLRLTKTNNFPTLFKRLVCKQRYRYER